MRRKSEFYLDFLFEASVYKLLTVKKVNGV